MAWSGCFGPLGRYAI